MSFIHRLNMQVRVPNLIQSVCKEYRTREEMLHGRKYVRMSVEMYSDHPVSYNSQEEFHVGCRFLSASRMPPSQSRRSKAAAAALRKHPNTHLVQTPSLRPPTEGHCLESSGELWNGALILDFYISALCLRDLCLCHP